MTLTEKIGSMFMIGFYGTELPAEVRQMILAHRIGSVILFSRNIRSIPQVQELTATLHSLGETPPLVFVDQEGGGIVRFGELAATAISAMGLSATGQAENAGLAGQILARDMRECGIDGIFAPVLDVNVSAHNPVIGIRSYGDDPETVAAYAIQFMRGVQDMGLLTCGKHFPGHGAATADSHLQIPEINEDYAFLDRFCLPPFRQLLSLGLDSVMTGHLRFPRLDSQIATFSPYFLQQLLREKMGYQGVIFTDCLEMNAVQHHYSPEQVVQLGVNAGLDIFSVSHTLALQQRMMAGLLHLVNTGVISEERLEVSVQRVAALRARALELKQQSRYQPPSGCGETRQQLDLEQKLAEESVTLLRNKRGLIPINKTENSLVLEWKKTIIGPSIQENEPLSMVARLAPQYLEKPEIITLDPEHEGTLPDTLMERLLAGGDERVLAFIYSRAGEVGRRQQEMVRRVLAIRPDTILISLENPYEIIKYPGASTFLVTYGFRMVQVEALFKILTGRIPPRGRCPVEIKELVPRGYGEQ